MTFGSIHDYLRRANGETAVTGIPWRNNGQQQNEETKDSTAKTEDTDSDTPKSEVKPKYGDDKGEAQNSNKEQPLSLKEPTTPASSNRKPSSRTKRKTVVSDLKPTPKAQTKISGSFEQMIEDFDQMKEAGKRHQFFVPDDVYNALQLTYGERRISAFFTVLAREFIAKHKEDMKQRIASRINLLSDSTDQ
jgi:DNA mismatch repair ATPase MutL